MSECSEFLKGGVFDTIIVNHELNINENLLEWLKKVDYHTFQEKVSGGLNIGFPIVTEGSPPIPIDIGIDFSEEDFNQWKIAVQEGKYRQFTENEKLQIIKKSASEVIVYGWLECLKFTNNGTGLICKVLSDIKASTILFKAQFIPHSPDDDKVPIINDFIVTGASEVIGLKKGDEIPFAGVTATIKREGKNAVTISLNTDKGTYSETIPEIIDPPITPPEKPPEPKPLIISESEKQAAMSKLYRYAIDKWIDRHNNLGPGGIVRVEELYVVEDYKVHFKILFHHVFVTVLHLKVTTDSYMEDTVDLANLDSLNNRDASVIIAPERLRPAKWELYVPLKEIAEIILKEVHNE